MEDEGSKACSQKSIADELDWGAAGELGLLSLIIHMRTHTHTHSECLLCAFILNDYQMPIRCKSEHVDTFDSVFPQKQTKK